MAHDHLWTNLRHEWADYFVECIQSGVEPVGLPNEDLSRDAQEIMEAGLLSAMNGVTVPLPVEDHLFRDV
jgi:predicted dehydrogenase